MVLSSQPDPQTPRAVTCVTTDIATDLQQLSPAMQQAFEQQRASRRAQQRGVSSSYTVYVVYQNSGPGNNLSAASSLLADCANVPLECNNEFSEVNSTNATWSTDPDPSNNVSDLLQYGIDNNLYAQADIVMGVTDVDLNSNGNDGVAGVAYLGDCSPGDLGPAVVIESATYAAVLGHELGHILGMRHDDGDPTAGGNASIMQSIVFPNPTDMSDDNVVCYRLSASCTAQPLPVELLAFSAEAMTTGNVLRWSTGAEVNNRGFAISRSDDAGLSWEEIHFVAARGSHSDYSWTDSAPGSAALYRLRQVDFDGTESYSPLVEVVRLASVPLQLYPNPTDGTVRINQSYDRTYLYDLRGQLLRTYTGEPVLDLDVPAGTYLLRIHSTGAVHTHRVVKTK